MAKNAMSLHPTTYIAFFSHLYCNLTDQICCFKDFFPLPDLEPLAEFSRSLPNKSSIPFQNHIIPMPSDTQQVCKIQTSYTLAETESFIENINKNISKICSEKDFRSCWEARESVQAIIDLLVRSPDISTTLAALKVRGLDYLTKKIPDADLKNLFFRQIDPRCLGKHHLYFIRNKKFQWFALKII